MIQKNQNFPIKYTQNKRIAGTQFLLAKLLVKLKGNSMKNES